MSGCNDDHCLVAATRAGQSDAFGILVRRYQDRLYPTVLRLTGSVDDALDLLQEAFLRAYLKLESFHGESSFYTWIYRIAVNLALSDRRRRKRGTWRFWVDGRGAPLDSPGDDRRLDPARPIEQAERDGLVQAALSALAPDHRAVVVLKDLDGLRYEEIAAILDIPIGTVRSRLHRAREELRDRLRDLFEDEDLPARPVTRASTASPYDGIRPEETIRMED